MMSVAFVPGIQSFASDMCICMSWNKWFTHTEWTIITGNNRINNTQVIAPQLIFTDNKETQLTHN